MPSDMRTSCTPTPVMPSTRTRQSGWTSFRTATSAFTGCRTPVLLSCSWTQKAFSFGADFRTSRSWSGVKVSP